jgi:plasmid stabilization system protein ParE
VIRPALLTRAAERDIDEARTWYRHRGGSPLADVFLDAVRTTIDRIECFPDANALVHRRTRRAFVPRFPYALFYAPRADRIHVLRCFHTSRDLARWLGTLE